MLQSATCYTESVIQHDADNPATTNDYGDKAYRRRQRISAASKQSILALRTIQNYESGERLHKQKENYQLLATALNVDVDTLKDDDADFVIKATEKYGARGNAQAERLVKEVSGLYAGGELAEEDMDAMMKAIQEAYWIAKEKNRKYVPKKYRGISGDSSNS